MSIEELKPCPSCGDRCFLPEKSNWFKGGVVQCTNADPGCEYDIEADTFDEAIRLHNSIPRGETCRWKAKDFCGGLLWFPSCDLGATSMEPMDYCPHCGKQIEEIEE